MNICSKALREKQLKQHEENMERLLPFRKAMFEELQKYPCPVDGGRGLVGGGDIDAGTVTTLTKVAALAGMAFIMYNSYNETTRGARAMCTGDEWRESMAAQYLGSKSNACQAQLDILRTSVDSAFSTGERLLMGAITGVATWVAYKATVGKGGRKTRRRKAKSRKSKTRKMKGTRKRR